MNQSAFNMTQLKALTEFFRHLSNISYTYLSNSTDMNVNSSSALNSMIVDLTARNLTISALNSKSIQTTVSREWQYLAGMILGIFWEFLSLVYLWFFYHCMFFKGNGVK
jgi:hypothetical protein